MTTALDIITLSLQQTMVYAPGESIDPNDAQTCLSLLNGMLDSFSVGETLTCFANVTVSQPLTLNVAQYSIGSGGAINAARPVKLPSGYGTAYILDSNNNNYAVQVITEYEWNLIGNRINNSATPDTLWYDPQYPLGYINLYPIPINPGYTLYITYTAVLRDFSTLQTVVTLPPGYQEMLMSNLSLRLKPFFSGAIISPDIRQLAMESKANVKRSNIKLIRSRVDSEITAKAPGTYNIYTDGFNAFPSR